MLLDDIKNRLKMIGYELKKEDAIVINFVIDKVVNSIKTRCNIEEVPNTLDQIIVDRVCGEFLFAKKGAGKLEDFDFAVTEKSIRIGDTTIDFAVNSNLSPEANFDRLLKTLMTAGESDLVSFRKLRW